jgi:hypothetical protein
MTRVMMRYTCEDTGGEWRSKRGLVGDLISGIAVSVTWMATSLVITHSPSVSGLPAL